MSQRHGNRLAARLARKQRRSLVHMAGCTEWSCAGIRTEPDAFEIEMSYRTWAARQGVRARRISVPRSLRPILGRFIGG